MFSKGMWGHQLLAHFLQDQHDRFANLLCDYLHASLSPPSCLLPSSYHSITFIESVEDFVLREVQKQIYNVFRYLLQIAYDAGKLIVFLFLI